MKITDKNFVEETKKQMEPWMQKLAAGMNVRDVAKDIYLTLPDKTEDIAYMMVDNMAEIIEKYHAEFKACCDDDDAYIREKLRESTKGIEDAADRCRVYHRMLVALAAHAICVEGGAEAKTRAEAYVNEHKAFDCTPEEAGQKEGELFELTVEALKQTDVLTMQLPAVLAQIQNEDFQAASGSFALGAESADLKLILAMQTYVNAQNGMYDDVSENASMEQLVYNVCGAVDASAVAAQAETGEVDESTAIKLLRVIGKVLGVIALASLAIDVMYIVGGLLWTFLPVSIFMSVVLATTLVLVGIRKLNLVEEVKNLGADILAGVGYLVGYVAGTVIKGVKKLIAWTAPYVKAGLGWIRDTVCSLIDRLADALYDHDTTKNENTRRNCSPAKEADREEDNREEEPEPNTVLA